MQSITARILDALRGLPAIGFVNEKGLQARNERDARVRLLEQWLEAGMELGNHTYSHPSPNNIPVEAYEADVWKGEVVLRQLQPKAARLFFRHPFTHTGPDAAYKARLESFLSRNGYDIAPFTAENSDYVWALVYRRALARKDDEMAARVRKEHVEHLRTTLEFVEQVSVKMFQREIPQTLLIHANVLHADTLPQLLRMLRDRGYQVIPLRQALADPAYVTPDRFVGRFGPSWLTRWAVAMGLPDPMAMEPPLPDWVTQQYSLSNR